MTKTQSGAPLKPWLIWALFFVPLFVGSMVVVKSFGLIRALPILLGLLAITLIYQRFIKKRAWRSILWGDQKSIPHNTSRN